ncbi:hypothetical protein BELL_0087g00220 [Botrytis elliptica]|uniref:Uncharacterized protein n=1 Tax=Botrytis elliptica TaxID=278938 RepID=A0A4Z1K952_9HELO|nr:hypothetical protein EAE99_011125 [Botrytis elliptica]TGO77887.1 hypothetical protein BELL_0087g00220 [Botrytis elliptica]
MGNKNARGSAAQARPSTAMFAELARKQQIETDAAQALAATPFDMSTLPAHPAIVILGDSEIGVRITKDTNMPALLTVLPNYEAHVNKIAVEIHTPPPHFESREKVGGRLEMMKAFYNIINKFKWSNLDVNVFLDTYNFPQMKLAAGLWGLKRKHWKLTYEVQGYEGDYVKVTDGSEFGRRLAGVYKREYLNLPKVIKSESTQSGSTQSALTKSKPNKTQPK